MKIMIFKIMLIVIPLFAACGNNKKLIIRKPPLHKGTEKPTKIKYEDAAMMTLSQMTHLAELFYISQVPPETFTYCPALDSKRRTKTKFDLVYRACSASKYLVTGSQTFTFDSSTTGEEKIQIEGRLKWLIDKKSNVSNYFNRFDLWTLNLKLVEKGQYTLKFSNQLNGLSKINLKQKWILKPSSPMNFYVEDPKSYEYLLKFNEGDEEIQLQVFHTSKKEDKSTIFLECIAKFNQAIKFSKKSCFNPIGKINFQCSKANGDLIKNFSIQSDGFTYSIDEGEAQSWNCPQ